MTSLLFDRLWDIGGNGLSASQMLDQFAPDRLPALVRCYAPMPDPVPVAPQRAYTAWGEGFGSFGHTDSSANYGSLDRSLGGFVLGIDTPIDRVFGNSWRTGVAVGYTDTTFRSPLDGGSGTVQGVYGSLYTGTRFGAVDVRLATTIGGTFTDASRAVAFPGFLDTEKSFNRGITVQSSAEVGYRFGKGSTVIEPIVGASFLHIHEDGFREAGGPAALKVAGLDNDLGTTTVGVRGEFAPFNSIPLVAHGFLAWQHLIGNASPATVMLAALNATASWISARTAANLVTDRTLAASARSIAEQTTTEDGLVQVVVPPAALEMFDTGPATLSTMRCRMLRAACWPAQATCRGGARLGKATGQPLQRRSTATGRCASSRSTILSPGQAPGPM